MSLVDVAACSIREALSHCRGMKMLLLDEYSTKLISVVLSRSELLRFEVVLQDRIEEPKATNCSHLTGVIIIEPNDISLQFIKKELKNPRMKQYYVYLTGNISDSKLEMFAASDIYCVVEKVHCLFLEHQPIGERFFTLGLPSIAPLQLPESPSFYEGRCWDQNADYLLERIISGLFSVIVSLGGVPTYRYSESSHLAKTIAAEAQRRQTELEKINLNATRDVLILILDRRDDPITGATFSWHYTAMVNELFKCSNNVVTLPEGKRIILNAESDLFLRENQYTEFGALGDKIKTYIEELKSIKAKISDVKSVDKMIEWGDKLREFEKSMQLAEQHALLINRLDSEVTKLGLLDIGEFEQGLVTDDYMDGQVIELLKQIEFCTNSDQALRLAFLQTLKYPRTYKSIPR